MRYWKLTVVLDYYEAMETYSRIGLLRSQGNLKLYWTTTKPRKLTVVLDYRFPHINAGVYMLNAVPRSSSVRFETPLFQWIIHILHSFRTSFPLVSSVVFKFSTRFECGF